MGKFWGVFFSIMTINFIVNIILNCKKIELPQISLITRIATGCLPLFLLIMWVDDAIPVDSKIIDGFIGVAAIIAGGGYFYYDRKKIKESKRK